jgi:hypothetical protein
VKCVVSRPDEQNIGSKNIKRNIVLENMETKQPAGERVRENTAIKKNKKIDQQIVNNIESYSRNPQLIATRVKELDKEWDIERVLELNMSILSILGISLAVFVNIYWLILPSIVLLFFIQHAIQGWCPPIPIFRYFKVRTRPEIDREKFALKAIRGDFERISGSRDAYEAFRATERI